MSISNLLPETLNRVLRGRKPKPGFVSLTDLNELRRSFDYDEMKKQISLRDQETDLWWKKYYYALRVVWASLAIGLLGISLWFTFWLTKGVGTGTLDFSGNGSFLNIIAGEIIINILGLVAIVMHFLFPSNSRKPSETNKDPAGTS